MNAEAYQELLDRAMSLMDERDSTVAPASIPGEISVTGRTLSMNGSPARSTVLESEGSPLYGGDIILSGNSVRVVPFGINLTNDLEYFMAPNINGRSLFHPNPRTLGRRYGGAAVYMECVFELYDDGIVPEDPLVGPPFRAILKRCNIVDRELGDPYPIKKAEVSLVHPDGPWAISDSEAKAYRLLGVYTRSGTVYNQNLIQRSSTNTTFDGRIIPPIIQAPTVAPVKISISFS